MLLPTINKHGPFRESSWQPTWLGMHKMQRKEMNFKFLMMQQPAKQLHQTMQTPSWTIKMTKLLKKMTIL